MVRIPRVVRARALATITTLAALLTLPATDARAQLNASLSVAAGATAPVSGLGDVAKVGYHVWVGADFRPSASPVGFRVDGMFTEMDHERIEDVNWRIISGTANVVFTRSPAEGPYLLGGLGIYRLSATTEGETLGDARTDAGVNLGIGVRFALTGFSTFAEVRYHYMFGDELTGGGRPAFIPFTFGVTF